MEITVIPKKERAKPRIGAYARVSSSSDAQEDSLAFQAEYWNKRFENDSSIEYVGLFSDDGISGKMMRNRKELNRLLEKVRCGEIDKIYTKSLSRFARNHMETLSVVRELRDLGVEIIFEKENIHTLDPKCSLVLSVFASLAEQELISMSKNQQWAVRKRFAKGDVYFVSTYGYKLINGVLEINPDEAKVVRRIFELYIKGYGATKIAQILDKENCPTKRGAVAWTARTVKGILFNESYLGDTLVQKSVYNCKSYKRNRGELPQYYIEETHEAIIDKDTFERIQEINEQRTKRYNPACNGGQKTALSGKIKCGNCGSIFKRKTCDKGKSYACYKWRCQIKDTKTKEACDIPDVKEDVFIELLIQSYNECLEQNLSFKDEICQMQLLQNMLETESELKKLHVKGYISDEQYRNQSATLLEQIKLQEQMIQREKFRNTDIKKYVPSAVYIDDMAEFLSKAVVNKDWTITFIFENGYETTKSYTNGRAGNVNGKLCKSKS